MAVYGIVGFVLLQIVDLAVPALLLPEWTYRLVALFLLIGFPVAVVIAWALELTPEGVRRTAVATPGGLAEIIAAPASKRWPAGVLALVGMTALLAGAWYVGRQSAPGSGADQATGPVAASIAVLPFSDLSGDERGSYFGDGLAEEVLGALSRVEGLRVAARTSAFRFRGEGADIRRIGEELGVESVLEGSVRRSGDRLRVQARLVAVDSGFEIWSGAYDRSGSDAIAIQEELAGSIVEALRPELGAAERSQIARVGTDDVSAHDLYLLGLHHWNRRTEPEIRKAIEYFGQAVAIDSGYAKAWAGQALAWAVLPSYSSLTMDDVNARVGELAARALALDSMTAEAYAAVGYISRDWEEPLSKAIAIDPSYAQAYGWLGVHEHYAGDDSSAQTHVTRAYELDPLAPIVVFMYAQVMADVGRFEEAERAYRRYLDREPEGARQWFGLAHVQLDAGHFDDALVSLRRWAELQGQDQTPFETLVRGIAEPGLRGKAIELLNRDTTSLWSSLSPRRVAQWYARLGVAESAIDWLERSAAPGPGRTSSNSGWIFVVPAFRSLAGDPRFEALRAAWEADGRF